MNTRAALLHWIVFGVIVSIGLFLILSNSFAISSQVKGQWHIDYLKKYLAGAELDLLELDNRIRTTSRQLIVNLAQKGGFDTLSSCGEQQGSPLWNKGEEWCLPDVKENMKKLLLLELQTLEAFSPLEQNIVVENTIVKGKGLQKKLQSPASYRQEYVYSYDFNAPLGYSFQEYITLATEAQNLVDNCRNQRNLQICAQGMFTHWKICSPMIMERIISFCVDSPSESIINDQLLEYKIALDFTPTTPFVVENVVAERKINVVEIRFPRDETIDSYNLYYTDWSGIVDKSGSPEIVFQDFTDSFGNFRKQIALINIAEENCPGDKNVNQVYLCAEAIVYIVEDTALTPEQNYYFAVTAVEGNEESEIGSFVKI